MYDLMLEWMCEPKMKSTFVQTSSDIVPSREGVSLLWGENLNDEQLVAQCSKDEGENRIYLCLRQS